LARLALTMRTSTKHTAMRMRSGARPAASDLALKLYSVYECGGKPQACLIDPGFQQLSAP
jgi:hypothetical protein